MLLKSCFALAVLVLGVGVVVPVGGEGPRTADRAAAWNLDASHSSVLFRIKHLDVSNFWGRFDKVEGSMVWDEADLTKCSVTIEIDAASVDTNNAERDTHVKGPDFFDTAHFPKMTFKSSSVKKKEGADSYELAGDLTFHGVTKAMTLEIRKVGSAETRMGTRCGFDCRFTLDRSDFGVKTYPATILGHEIEVLVALECVKG